MPIYICETCGTSFPEDTHPPGQCLVCEDERQFVPRKGQTWITVENLLANHANTWRRLEPGLLQIHTYPQIGIGQRAFLIQTSEGNILWDCLALIDDATKTIIDGLGGLRAIAISHPHYYTRMQDWGARFRCTGTHPRKRPGMGHAILAIASFLGGRHLGSGRRPDRSQARRTFPWIFRPTLAARRRRRGTLLSGDTIEVVHDTSQVTFMWSYPNMMPLPGAAVQRIAGTLEPWPFERVYGAFPGLEVLHQGKAAIMHSAARYVELLASNK